MIESFYNEKINGFRAMDGAFRQSPSRSRKFKRKTCRKCSTTAYDIKKLGALSAFFGLPNGDVVISSVISDKEKGIFDVLDGDKKLEELKNHGTKKQ